MKFRQKALLKQYMKKKKREKAKNYFEKCFIKLMNNSFFGKTMENVRKHRDIKLLKTEEEGVRTKLSYN